MSNPAPNKKRRTIRVCLKTRLAMVARASRLRFLGQSERPQAGRSRHHAISKHSLRIVGSLLVFLGILATPLVYRRCRHSRDASDTASCANHSHQSRMRLLICAGEHPDLILPSTNDTCAALVAIFTSYEQDAVTNVQQWVQHPGSACPESFRRDGGIGYVYVGDGLRLGDVEEKGILIMFCPGENHRGTSEHCCALNNADGWFRVVSNKAMVSELKRALSQGESGKVKYSARAMSVLRQELEKRQNPK